MLGVWLAAPEDSYCPSTAQGPGAVCYARQEEMGRADDALVMLGQSAVALNAGQPAVEIAPRFHDEPGGIRWAWRIDAEHDPEIGGRRRSAPRQAENDTCNRDRVTLLGICGATFVVKGELRMPLERAVTRERERRGSHKPLSKTGSVASRGGVGNGLANHAPRARVCDIDYNVRIEAAHCDHAGSPLAQVTIRTRRSWGAGLFHGSSVR